MEQYPNGTSIVAYFTHIEKSVYNPIYLDYLNNPHKFWESHDKLYHYSPILVTGDRTDSKYEVAIETCKDMGNGFDVREDIAFDEDDIVEKTKGGGHIILTESQPWSDRRMSYHKKNIALRRLIESSRYNGTVYCMTTSSPENVDASILSLTHHLLNVVKTTEDYHIVECLEVNAPFSINTIIRPPNFSNMEEDEAQSLKYDIHNNTFFRLMKYPRADGFDMWRFNKQWEEHSDKILENLKSKISDGDD